MNFQTNKTILTFMDLDAWKKGHDFVLEIYRTTKIFPEEERFGLVAQMRRCVVSVTSNIAEGFGRRSCKDKARFYVIALGSVVELQNQLLICKDVGYLKRDFYETLLEKTIVLHKLVNGLVRSQKQREYFDP